MSPAPKPLLFLVTLRLCPSICGLAPRIVYSHGITHQNQGCYIHSSLKQDSQGVVLFNLHIILTTGMCLLWRNFPNNDHQWVKEWSEYVRCVVHMAQLCYRREPPQTSILVLSPLSSPLGIGVRKSQPKHSQDRSLSFKLSFRLFYYG